MNSQHFDILIGKFIKKKKNYELGDEGELLKTFS